MAGEIAARFGIGYAPDGLLVTGPVTANMHSALLDTYAAVPEPKLVIASGACAIGGGPYQGSPEQHNGIGDLLPVDRIRRFLTMTAPCLRRTQFERVAVSRARFRKYWSHSVGRWSSVMR